MWLCLILRWSWIFDHLKWWGGPNLARRPWLWHILYNNCNDVIISPDPWTRTRIRFLCSRCCSFSNCLNTDVDANVDLNEVDEESVHDPTHSTATETPRWIIRQMKDAFTDQSRNVCCGQVSGLNLPLHFQILTVVSVRNLLMLHCNFCLLY